MDLTKLIERTMNLLIRPKEEWPVIAEESATAASLFRNWILIFAAIMPIAGLIGLALYGLHISFGDTIGIGKIGARVALGQMVLRYVVQVGMAYVLALLIDALAPSFGGEKNPIQALKTAAYGWTAAWLGGVFYMTPGLGVLYWLGVAYSIYLLYLGLSVTMKAPEDRAGGYTAAVVVVALILSLVLGAVVDLASGVKALTRGVVTGALSSEQGEEPVPHLDPNSALAKFARAGAKIEEAGKKMDAAEKTGDKEAQAKAAQQVMGAILGGGDSVESLPPDMIKPFLPDTLGGLKRASLSAEKNGIMGIQVSKGEAVYRDDGSQREIRLEVTDTGGAKGAVGFAGWAVTEQDKQADWGYEKVYHQGSRLVHEQWHTDSKHGEYGLLLAGRFAIKLDCDGIEMDEIKRIAASLDTTGLEALKDQGVKKG